MSCKVLINRSAPGLKHPEAGLYIRKAIKKALSAENITLPCCISVTLTNDEGIREINRECRGIDKSTDVLSFPMNEFIPGNADFENAEYDYSSKRFLLGDMVISVPTCERQGAEFGHGFKREVMYLTVHSVLHLLGYDHVDEAEMKAQMRDREKTIMGDR